MKRIFTLMIFFCCSQVYGQYIVFQEDFDHFPGYNIVGWHQEFTGRVPWYAGLPYEVGDCMSPYMARTTGTNKVACVPACADNRDTNVFTYSPPIHFSTVHGAWLRYDSYFEKISYSLYTEKATVEVSTDSGKTWAVVQDVPANSSLAYFTTYYIDLSAYDYTPNIWIGFRYSNDSTHSPYGMAGWAIDNVEVFVPDHKDLALTQMTPNDSLLSYATQGTGIIHSGTIYNAGLDTIHSFTINYRQGTGPIHSAAISGVNIPRFSTYQFTHPYADTVTGMDNYNVTMWVSTTGDIDPANDTQKTVIRGAYFMPVKKLAIEEGTGTWNPRSPQTWVYMNELPTYDLDACEISVHDHDVMSDSAYSDYLYYLHYDYVPYMLIDRHKIEVDSFFKMADVQKKYFGFADIALEPVITGNELNLTAHVKPAIDLAGDLRLMMVITQDDVTGASPDYDQLNEYASGAYGVMGGFESKPARVPASDMYYNFVARSIQPSPDGMKGMLPATLKHNNVYDYSFHLALDTSWHKLRAVVLLLRNDDTTVLNAAKIEWYLNVASVQEAQIDANIYPNPATETAYLYFNLPDKENIRLAVTDVSGRLIYMQPNTSYLPGRNEIILSVHQFANGLYLVNLVSNHARKTVKLDVLH